MHTERYVDGGQLCVPRLHERREACCQVPAWQSVGEGANGVQEALVPSPERATEWQDIQDAIRKWEADVDKKAAKHEIYMTI